MPAECDECGSKVGYGDVVNHQCDLGYDHSICHDCLKEIKMKAKNFK